MNKPTLNRWGRPVVQLAVVAAAACAAESGWSQSRFSVSPDGTEVTDTRTGLVWRRCSAGQAYSGGTCIGTASTYTMPQALAYAKSQSVWRLPNVKELSSIVDTDRRSPAVDPVAFPATPSLSYWSSSPLAGSPGSGWYVDFLEGGVIPTLRYNDAYLVRLVR